MKLNVPGLKFTAMYKLELKLKQQTPIIHFQHEQDGDKQRYFLKIQLFF